MALIVAMPWPSAPRSSRPIAERLYAICRLSPFGAPRIRAVKKEQKHYHWDWTLVSTPGVRFENLVASHLLKWVHFRQDTEGLDLDLRYFRDHDRREVDFVVVDGRTPLLMVECKLDDAAVDPGLRYRMRSSWPDSAFSLRRNRCSSSTGLIVRGASVLPWYALWALRWLLTDGARAVLLTAQHAARLTPHRLTNLQQWAVTLAK